MDEANGKGKVRADYPVSVHLPNVAYEYSPLPTKEPHVRLLMLVGVPAPAPSLERVDNDEDICCNISAPGDDPLCAILFTTPLSEVDAEYIALSYTWGTGNRTKNIHTPTGFLHITSNLDAALRRLLNDFGQGVCVWADAVCIDQRNDVEKAGQIRLMPSIYACAERVAAYLGAEDADSARAVELIWRLSNCEFNDEKTKPRNLDDLERCGLPALDDKMWVALRQFLARPWFRRVWIVQECVLAKSVWLLWGKEWSLPFEALGAPILRFFEVGIPLLSVVPQPLVHPAATATVSSPIDAEVLVKGWSCTAQLVYLQMRRKSGAHEDLLHILELCRDAEATVKRDKYFALVGLTRAADDLDENSDLRPDYKEPFIDVSIRYTRYLLKSRAQEEAIKILSLAQPRFPDPALPLPSWVPDWSKKLEASTLICVQPHPVRDNLYRTATFSPPYLKIDESADGRTLVVRGAAFRPIVFVGLDHWTKYRYRQVQATVLLLMMDVRMFGQSIKSYPTGEPVMDVLWKTITLNLYSSSAGINTSYRTGLPNAALISSVSVARRFFESAKDFGNSSAVREIATTQNYNAAGIAFATLGNDLHGWKFAILSGYYVSMVPITAQKGDIVVIISGARVPYVLRPVPHTKDSIRYNLVGECYVHGIMQGELQNNYISFEWNEFCLV